MFSANMFSNATIAKAKRDREEDDQEFEEIRVDRKKPRTLPFRTSPTTCHTTLFSQSRNLPNPPVLTPVESSEDEDEISTSAVRGSRSSHHVKSIYVDDDSDSDFEMTDSQTSPDSPLWSPHRPWGIGTPAAPRNNLKLGPVQAMNLNTRIPTPIYGHFIQDASKLPPTTLPNISDSMTMTMKTKSTARLQDEQHDLFLRRRRLPSPISEDEDMNSPTTMTGGMLRNLDMSATPSTGHFFNSKGNGGDVMTPVTPDTATIKDFTSATESTWRDDRRGAVDAGKTDHSAGKVVFSMGFRADCDKCRERVPGHWSHVLRI